MRATRTLAARPKGRTQRFSTRPRTTSLEIGQEWTRPFSVPTRILVPSSVKVAQVSGASAMCRVSSASPPMFHTRAAPSTEVVRMQSSFGEKVAQVTGKTIVDEVAEQGKTKIGPKSKVNIINNKHPMIQNIDTIGAAKKDEDAMRKSVWLLSDSAKVVEQKVQDLSGSTQRDKYVKDLLNDNDAPTKTYESFVHSPG